MRFGAAIAMVSVTLAGSAFAQDNGGAYQLRTSTRIVAEDVTVTDAKGNPVGGLPQSAFHLVDDDKPQMIRSFEESTQQTEAQGPGKEKTGQFSNAALNQNTGTIAVLLVDPIGLELPDQMYLRLQMLKYLKQMPEGTQAIVFRATSRGTPVLLQSLTSDRGLLTAALDRSVPTQPRPVYSNFSNAIDELANMSEYLRNVPGKKALLWFAGQFPLYVQPNFTGDGGSEDTTQAEQERREAYRALEAARIAVYPIDVRGVVMGGTALNQASDTVAAANDPSATTRATGGESSKAAAAYNDMDSLANATGGRAFYSQNYVWKAMGDAITIAGHAYTLTYRPEPYVEDGKWHKVKLTVDGPYQVHYRTGYYAGVANESAPEKDTRRRLELAGRDGGSVLEPRIARADAQPQQQPITFSAQVKPDGSEGKRRSYAITYTIPTKTLDFKLDPGGKHEARFRVAVVAYNADGDILGKDLQVIETHFTNEQMTLADRGGAPAKQTVVVPKGAEYLMLAVQDLDTQRVGVVQMSLKSVAETK